MVRVLPIVLASLLAGCAGPGAAPSLRYDVRFEPGADAALAVEVAIDPPWGGGRWSLDVPPLGPLVVRVDGEARELGAGGRLEVEPGARRLAWRHELTRAGGDLVRGAGEGGAWCVGGRAYLLHPVQLRGDTRVTLAFSGPTGDAGALDPDLAGPLLPWARERPDVVTLTAQALLDPGLHVFGGVRRRDGPCVVAILAGPRAAGDDEVVAWLAQARAEVLTVRRDFPQARLTVAVVPLRGVREASPFGLVQWSAPPSMALYLGGEADAAALARDWVAVHEHMHLAHPRVAGEHTGWLREGLATYLALVARLRSGRLSPEDGWGQLVGGVLDGAQLAGDRSLPALTASMHRLHAYGSVYWGGALLALELDLALREATAGRVALDDVVAGLQRAGRSILPGDLIDAVDAAAGAEVGAPILRAHTEGPALARAHALLADLGLRPDGPGARAALGVGPRAALRDAIGAR